jgi:zinc/manganese transport system substrate-binding protein
MKKTSVLLAVVLFLCGATQATPVKVVTTLSSYAAIARQLGGDRVSVKSIAPPDADPHFIKPKPSYALMLRDADLFVSTGLDLEMWVPALVEKAGNRRIVEGNPGYVSASTGVTLLQKPATLSRLGGDIHVYGNPHIATSPINAKIIARNIAAGLCNVDSAGCPTYKTNLAGFERDMNRRLYGDRLVDALGADVLDPLAQSGQLIPFLRDHGQLNLLGGWLATGMAFRDRDIICYHKQWVYFTSLFGLKVVGYVEPKPGIPPTARHVAELIDTIQGGHVKVLLSADYHDPNAPTAIAERTGILVVRVPVGTGEEGLATFADLVDLWVNRLAAAYGDEEAS